MADSTKKVSIVRRTGLVVVGCLVLAVTAGATWLEVSVQKVLPVMAALPAQVANTLVACEKDDAEGGSQLPDAVSRFVASNVAASVFKDHRSLWPVKVGTLWLYVNVRLSREGLLALYANYLPYEGGHGMPQAAEHYFSKPLEQLSVKEIVFLVAVGRSPGMARDTSNEDFQRVYNQLLARAGA